MTRQTTDKGSVTTNAGTATTNAGTAKILFAPTDSIYIHGSDPEEQRRLSTLNAFMNGPSLREINVQPGERILDVGSGLAQLTRAMARAARRERAARGERKDPLCANAGYVLGIERDPRQLAEAHRQAKEAGEESLVELREGNAYDPPLRDDEWGTFDLAHARFVLEHVPDPLRVVRMMLRAVKPGGRIVLEDDDHEVLRFHPEPPHFRVFWDAYVKTYEHVGNDPFVGRKLVSLMHEAGALPTRNTWIFFGTCKKGERKDSLCAQSEPRTSVRADDLSRLHPDAPEPVASPLVGDESRRLHPDAPSPIDNRQLEIGNSASIANLSKLKSEISNPSIGNSDPIANLSNLKSQISDSSIGNRQLEIGNSPAIANLSNLKSQISDSSIGNRHLKIGNSPPIANLSNLKPQISDSSIGNRHLEIGNPPDTFAAAVSNLEGIIRFSRRDIVDPGLLDAATFDTFEREFHEWSKLPDAALWYAICFAEGRKPSAD